MTEPVLRSEIAKTAERVSPNRAPLPAVMLPADRDRRRGSAVVSILIHALIILLLIGPFTFDTSSPTTPSGPLGLGPAGGGGGGHQGTGGVQTHVQFIQPVPPPPTPQVQPVLPPLAVVPPPVVKPPDPVPTPVVPPPTPTAPEQKVETKPDPAPAAATEISSAVPGTGGGSGRDGSAGAGPGSGGGVGSGIGLGRGSGVGPGSGGNGLNQYDPTPTEIFIPPFPIPGKVKGTTLTAIFKVDKFGGIIGVAQFNPTKDKDYNERLQEVLNNFRFRPAVTADGTPVEGVARISYVF